MSLLCIHIVALNDRFARLMVCILLRFVNALRSTKSNNALF